MNSIKTNKSLRILKDELSLKGNSFVDIKTASDWIYDSKNAPIPKELIIYKSNLRAQLLTIEG